MFGDFRTHCHDHQCCAVPAARVRVRVRDIEGEPREGEREPRERFFSRPTRRADHKTSPSPPCLHEPLLPDRPPFRPCPVGPPALPQTLLPAICFHVLPPPSSPRGHCEYPPVHEAPLSLHPCHESSHRVGDLIRGRLGSVRRDACTLTVKRFWMQPRTVHRTRSL